MEFYPWMNEEMRDESIFQVTIVLDSRSGLIKSEFITLLKCDANEVVHGLVPHLGQVLVLLARSKTIGTEQIDSSVIEIGKALIKCETKISRTNNWRLSETVMDQLQVLPKCFSSDYIYTNFVPLTIDRVLNSRPIPVRLAAGKTLLVFLRYNLKSLQRTELRNKIHTELACSQNCYTRMLFTRIMNEALSLFSSVYFKEHFFSTLLSMTEDPVANIRLKIVTMLPKLKALLKVPTDKKLLVTLETNIRHLMNTEKDKDVICALMQTSQKLNDVEVRHEGQTISTNLSKLEAEDIIKYEEEQKLENMTAVCSVKKNFGVVKTAGPKRTNFGEPSTLKNSKNETEIVPKSMSSSGKVKQPADAEKSTDIKMNSMTANQAFDSTKTSTSSNNLTSSWERLASNSMLLKHPWERMGPPDSDKLEKKSFYPHVTHYPYNCYKASYIFQPQILPSKSSDQEPKELSCRSYLDYLEYLRSKNLRHRHDSNLTSDFDKSLLLTHLDEDKHELLQDFFLTRNDIDGSKTPDLVALQALTNAVHYNSCWAFSSISELPITFLDDEFIIDAGIRIPSQISKSPSTSKIPNLEDIIYRNKGMNVDRSRRYSSCGIADFQKGKPKGQEYKKSAKPTSSLYLPANTHYKNETRAWYSDDHQFAQNSNCNKFSSSKTKGEFEMSQEKSYDGMKRNSGIVNTTKLKSPQRNIPDRSKRHSTIYSLDLPNSRNTKPHFKRHSIEVTDHTPVECRALRRYSTFDLNHNQGPSKIPLRCFQSGSRTAPATRASSPIRAETRLCFQRSASQQTNAESSFQERRFGILASSNEKVDKLCQKLLYRQTAPCKLASSPKSKDSRLPIRFQREKL